MSANGPRPEGLVSHPRSEVANDLVTGDRTKPQRRKRFSRFPALALGLAFLFAPTAVHASCAVQKVITLSLCQEDVCTDGFQVENFYYDYDDPYDVCRTRPVVRDLTGEERVNFRDIIQRLGRNAANGIYQLHAYPGCLRRGRNDSRCLAEASITRLSDASGTQTLAQHRSEWLVKERQAHRAAILWSPPILLGLFTLLLLAWPWVLVALKPSLRKYIVYMSVAAVPGQVIAFWVFEIHRERRSPTFEWPWIGATDIYLLYESLILLVVALQFGYFIWQKFKPRTL